MPGSDDLDGLPETYALALRLQAEGLDGAAIGRVLDIETESVDPLLDLATSKLAGLGLQTETPNEASGDSEPP
jgi:hypothetical protein